MKRSREDVACKEEQAYIQSRVIDPRSHIGAGVPAGGGSAGAGGDGSSYVLPASTHTDDLICESENIHAKFAVAILTNHSEEFLSELKSQGADPIKSIILAFMKGFSKFEVQTISHSLKVIPEFAIIYAIDNDYPSKEAIDLFISKLERKNHLLPRVLSYAVMLDLSDSLIDKIIRTTKISKSTAYIYAINSDLSDKVKDRFKKIGANISTCFLSAINNDFPEEWIAKISKEPDFNIDLVLLHAFTTRSIGLVKKVLDRGGKVFNALEMAYSRDLLISKEIIEYINQVMALAYHEHFPESQTVGTNITEIVVSSAALKLERER